jgi:CRP-like cAMP-binding protein
MATDHLGNRLLAQLDKRSIEAVEPYLRSERLLAGQVLAETHSHIQNVYFPHGGIISCLVEMEGGGAIQTGMIGRDGQFGAGAALDHKVCLNYVLMQIESNASVIDADRFRSLVLECPELRKAVLRDELLFLAQVQQTAACNAVHSLQARACKWLLRMHALAGDDLPLTQQYLAEMIGVQRSGVNRLARELQASGLITYLRGRVRIVDLAAIRTRACECDGALSVHKAVICEE